MQICPPSAEGRARPDRHRRAVGAWYLFDWAAQPFFTLVVTFLFGPYFAATLAPDPVTGQALWGYAGAAAGLVVAFAAPVLGAYADRSHDKKRWLLGFSVVFIAGCLTLGLAVPDARGTVWIALAGFAVASIGAELATVFTNAMMPDLAGPARMGRLSGNGMAIGYLGGLVSILIALALVQADADTGRTRLGREPMFGLVSAEASTAVIGPLCAAWYVLFVWPLFVFVPEPPTGRGTAHAHLSAALLDLSATVAEVARDPRLWRFLVGSMLFRDGMTALATLGGIYAAGVLGWTATEVGLFALLVVVAATLSAWGGGHLDDRIGADRVLVGCLSGLILATVLLASVNAEAVLFVIPAEPIGTGEGLFGTTADVAMLVAAGLIGLFFGPSYAAARSMMVRISPPDRITALFGLYALTGKLTSFLGPLAVALATDLFASQRAGAAVIPLFLLAGIVLLPRLPRAEPVNEK